MRAEPIVTELIYVPFNAAGVHSGVARMPRVVRDAGLETRLPAPIHTTWVTVTGLTPDRGRRGLISEFALGQAVVDTAAALDAAWRGGKIPMVVAGDCTMLLAPLIPAIDRGGAGLVFIDGHEDAWDPHRTPTGEASDCEIGLALGLFSGPQALDARLPCLRPEHVAMLGPRDRTELAEAGQPSLRDHVAVYVDGFDLASRTDIADLVASSAGTAPGGWWCHVDLDVLDTASLPAVDYPQPGGLTWDQLEKVVSTCLSVDGCLGVSVVIYNPDLDDGGSAGRIADFIAFVRARLVPTNLT
ncbi:arginase family protein [Mycobacterium sp. LTG2003]